MTDREFEYLTFTLPRLRPGSDTPDQTQIQTGRHAFQSECGSRSETGVSSCLDPTQSWIPDSDLDPDLVLDVDIDLELDP